MNDRSRLDTVKAVVESVPELNEGWAGEVENAFAMEQASREIQAYVKDHPGTVQSKLKDLISTPGEMISEVAYWLDRLGKLRRVKVGRSYELYDSGQAVERNKDLSMDETIKSLTFEIHDIEVTRQVYSGMGQTALKLRATIHVREPEFQNKSYVLVLHENVTESRKYVTVENGRGTLDISNFISGSKPSDRTDPDQVKVSLIG